MTDLLLFDEVAETVRALVPAELGPLKLRVRRYGINVWFETEQPPREHYEAQVIGSAHVDEVSVLAIEVGFHCENRDQVANDRELARLVAAEPTWRPMLGAEADPEIGMELGARLTDYLVAPEPVRRLPGL